MATPLRVLLIEASGTDALAVVRELRLGGYAPVWERVDTAAAVHVAAAKEWDLIICDTDLGHYGGSTALEFLPSQRGTAPIIVVSDAVSEAVAVSAIKAGASDCVDKRNLARLIPAVARALREAEVRRARQRAEEALHRSQAGLQAILNNSLQSFILTDCDGKIRAFNQIASVRVEMLFGGYPLAEGAALADTVPAAYRTAFEQDFARARAGEVVVIERTVPDQRGVEHWFELNFIPVYDDAGAVTDICVSALDITDRKQAERALLQTQRRLQTFIAHAIDLIFTLDALGCISSVNDAVRTVTGYAASELVGRSPLHLVAPRSLDAARTALAEVLSGAHVGQVEVEIMAKDGRLVWLEIRGHSVYEGERLVESFHIARDITERKTAVATTLPC